MRAKYQRMRVSVLPMKRILLILIVGLLACASRASAAPCDPVSLVASGLTLIQAYDACIPTLSGGTNLASYTGAVQVTANAGNGTDQISNLNVNGVLNVKAWGALSNDTGCQDVAIQNAIEFARTTGLVAGTTPAVYLPAGAYRTCAPIVLRGATNGSNNPFFLGAGLNQTFIDAQFTGDAVIGAVAKTYPTYVNITLGGNIISGGSVTNHSLAFASTAIGPFNLAKMLGNTSTSAPLNGLGQLDIQAHINPTDVANRHCIWASDGGLNLINAPGLFTAGLTGNIGALGYLCIGADAKLYGSLNVNGTEIRVNSGATTLTANTEYEVELNLDGSHNVNLYLGNGTVTRVAQTASGGTTTKQRFDESNFLGADMTVWPWQAANLQSVFQGSMQSVRISNTARNTGASYAEDTGNYASDANTLFLWNGDGTNFPNGAPYMQADKCVGGTATCYLTMNDLGTGCCGGLQPMFGFTVKGSATGGIFGNAVNLITDWVTANMSDGGITGIETSSNATFGSVIKDIPVYASAFATVSPLMILGGIQSLENVSTSDSAFNLILAGGRVHNLFLQDNTREICSVVVVGGGEFDDITMDSEGAGDFDAVCLQNATFPTRVAASNLNNGTAGVKALFAAYGPFTGKLTLDSNLLSTLTGATPPAIVDATFAHAGGLQVASALGHVDFINNNFAAGNVLGDKPNNGTNDIPYTNNGLAYSLSGQQRSTFADLEMPMVPNLVSTISTGAAQGSCASPCSVTLPANIPQGTGIFVVFDFGNQAIPSITASGWTLSSCSLDDHATSSHSWETMWKIAGPNDAGSSPTFTFGGGITSGNEMVSVVSGVDQTNPIGSCHTATHASASTFSLTGGTLTNLNSATLVVAGDSPALAITPTPPALPALNFTYAATNPNGSANQTWLYVSHNGTTQPALSLATASGSSTVWAGFQEELLPDLKQTAQMAVNQGAPPIPYGASFPLLNGLRLAGPAPVISACGGTIAPTTGSSNYFGEVTGGGAATSCTLAFANGGFPNFAACALNDETTVTALRPSSISKTGFTVNNITAGDKFTYACGGN